MQLKKHIYVMANKKKNELGELSLAFLNGDSGRIVELTKNFPSSAKNTLPAIIKDCRERQDEGMTPLIAAILHNNTFLFKKLLKEGVDMNQTLEKGFKCCSDEDILFKFHKETASQVVNGKTDKSLKLFKKTTPMYWIIRYGQESMIEELIEGGYQKDLFAEKFQGLTALMCAILNDNIDAVQELLRNKVDLHAASFEGGKPIELAIERNLPQMVRILIKHGENPNCVLHQHSPLLYAIGTNKIKMVEVLLDEGADIEFGVSDKVFVRPIELAINIYYFDIVKLLITRGADMKARFSGGKSNNCTALMCLTKLKEQGEDASVSKSKFELTKLMVEKGAEVNAVDRNKESPLFGAINCMNYDIVKYLLSKKAKVNLKNANGDSPLFAAMVPSNATQGKLLLSAESKFKRHCDGGILSINSPYIVPNQREIVELLINAGADVNSTNQYGLTPLYAAVGNNNLEMINILLEHGANPNVKRKGNYPLVCYATADNLIDALKLLISKNVDLNVKNENGHTALHIAISNKNLEIVELLLKSGADITVSNFLGVSPLLAALTNRSYKISKMLIQAGANINESNNHKRSLLHEVSQRSDLKSVKLLIENGASVQTEDRNGLSPLDLGIFNLNFGCEFAEIFLENGADVMKFGNKGFSTYSLVIFRHDPKLLKLFWQYGCPVDEPEAKLSKEEIIDLYPEYFLLCRSAQDLPGIKNNVLFSKMPVSDEEKSLRSAQEKFFNGIQTNNVELVLCALAEGAEPRGCSKELPFPLHYATKQGYHGIVEILLKRGIPPNASDNNDEIALQLALANSDIQCSKLLLHYGSFFNVAPSDLNGELLGIFMQLSQIAKKILETYPQLVPKLLKSTNDLDRLDLEPETFNSLYQQLANFKNYAHKDRQLFVDCRKTLDNLSTKCETPANKLTVRIYKVFKLVKKGDMNVVNIIRKLVNNENWEEYRILANCVDDKGLTLLATALNKGHIKIAEELMKIRLQVPDED